MQLTIGIAALVVGVLLLVIEVGRYRRRRSGAFVEDALELAFGIPPALPVAIILILVGGVALSSLWLRT